MEDNKKKLPGISSSPHFRSSLTTRGDMLTVCTAMLPMIIWGACHFGPRTLLVTVCTVLAAVVSEYVYETFMGLPVTIDDLSAVVTGMILSLNMPPSIPIWVPMVGAVFAIVVVKQLYGGLGQNVINPAVAARCFLHIAYASLMTDFSVAGIDSFSGATPLATMASGGTVSWTAVFNGNIPGTIGEVSAFCVIIGACFMMWNGVISPRIPFIYIGTVAVFMFITGGFDPSYAMLQVFSGGLLFGAFFMATDYVTSPCTPKGQVVYALFLGIMTGVIRAFSTAAEGVSYSIMLGNILVPMIERVTMPTAFGMTPKKILKGGGKS